MLDAGVWLGRRGIFSIIDGAAELAGSLRVAVYGRFSTVRHEPLETSLGWRHARVVGEYERAFSGRQALQIVALLNEHGVALWLPETLGPVDLDAPVRRTLIIEIGARSAGPATRSPPAAPWWRDAPPPPRHP